MRQMILMVGPPASGKSTYAQALEGFTRISQDDMGKMEHLTEFQDALARGENVVVDRLNHLAEQRQRYLLPAKIQGYTTKIVIMCTPKSECLARFKTREAHPTIKNETDMGRATEMFTSKYEPVREEEADIVERVLWKTERDKAVVFDLDNTVSDASHREHFLKGEKRDWNSFFNAQQYDKPFPWAVALMNAIEKLDDGTKIVICTARPDTYRSMTEEWLFKHQLWFDELFMRSRSDRRRDDIIKENMFEFDILSQYDVLFHVDDRKMVIDALRKKGITVLDCAGEKGNF